MGFGEQIGILFTGMSPLVLTLLVIGTVFLVIEIFTAGFGFFGIAGGILEIAAIVLRAIKGDGNPVAQVALLLLFIAIVCLIAFGLMAILTKLGVIKRTSLISTGTAVGKDRSEGTKDYTALLGKTGRTRTDLRPVGKAEIEGEIYDVVGDDFIPKGEKIEVVAVEGIKISVVKR